MAEVFAVLQNIQQVYEIIHWAVDVYKGIKGAPQAVFELTGEVECLVTCLNAFNYDDCRAALMDASDAQQKDFSTILTGCKLNLVELKTFVRECQIIMKETESAYKKKQKQKGLLTRGADKVKSLWKRYNFSQTDKQPMRDKLAIPLHSLNVFLISLTFSRTSLGNGIPSNTPVAPKNWAVIGSMISFKEAKFTSADLIRPGTEQRILEAAHSIIFGHRCIGHCCPCCTCDANSCHCDDDDGISTLAGGSMISPGPGHKHTGSKGRVVSDKMYLVRPKSKQRGRSKSVVRRVKREVFPTGNSNIGGRRVNDDDIDGSLASDLLDSDDSPPRLIQSYLTPSSGGPPQNPRMPSPHRDADRTSYEHYDRGRRSHRPSSPMSDFGYDEHNQSQHTHRPRLSQAEIDMARRQARETAATEIREVGRQAREELELGMDVAEREIHRRSESRRHTAPEPVDIRRYMEIRYGIVIDRATSEERRVAEEAEGLQEINEELRRVSERRSRMASESHGHHRRSEVATETVFEEFDLQISEDSEEELDPVLEFEPEVIELRARNRIHRRPERQSHNRSRFVIPDTEYEPVTTSLMERRSGTTTTSRRRQREEEHRTRDDALADLERRERHLQEQEASLRSRERELEERLRRLNSQERERERERSRGSGQGLGLEPGLAFVRRRPSAQIYRRHSEMMPPHSTSFEIGRDRDEEIVGGDNDDATSSDRSRHRIIVPEEHRTTLSTRQRENPTTRNSRVVSHTPEEYISEEPDRNSHRERNRRRQRIVIPQESREHGREGERERERPTPATSADDVIEILPEIRVEAEREEGGRRGVRREFNLDSYSTTDSDAEPPVEELAGSRRDAERYRATVSEGSETRPRIVRRRSSSGSPPRMILRH